MIPNKFIMKRLYLHLITYVNQTLAVFIQICSPFKKKQIIPLKKMCIVLNMYILYTYLKLFKYVYIIYIFKTMYIIFFEKGLFVLLKTKYNYLL